MLRLTTHLRDAWAAALAMLPIGIVPAMTAFAAVEAVALRAAPAELAPVAARAGRG